MYEQVKENIQMINFIDKYMMYIHNDSFPIKSAFLSPFRIRKRNLSELCSDNMHFKLIDMKTKGM